MRYIAFAIDPGRSGGWAIALNQDEVSASGVARTPQERIAACNLAAEYREDTGYPVVVVAEDWTAGGWKNHKALLGVGREFGRWLDHIELILGVKLEHFFRLYPQTWKNIIFTSADLKAASRVKEGHKVLACQYTGVKEHDRADAMCMAMASYSTEGGPDAAIAAAKRMARMD